MQYKKYTSEGFNNIRAIAIFSFAVLIILMLFGIPIRGVGKQVYLVFISFLASVYFMIPGVMVFIHPWISQAWLSALHSVVIPNKPWDELSSWRKIIVFISSFVSLVAGITILVLSILSM